MRILKKAAVSTVAVGLLAFGAVAGSGGSALAGPVVPWGLLTGCITEVATVTVGLQPNCAAFGAAINNPTVIVIDVDTDQLSALINAQEGQGMDASWVLSCVVNGTTVNTPGSYEVTSTDQLPYKVINLQETVGSPEPTHCTVEELKVKTALALSDAALEVPPFGVGVVAVADLATPGGIYHEEGTTSTGAPTNLCADDTANGNAGSKIQGFQCRSDLAEAFVRTSSGQLVHNGDCVGLSGSKVILSTCTAGKPSQRWLQATVGGTVRNQSSNTCLTAPSAKEGTQLTVMSCGNEADQKWHLPAASAATIVPCAAVRFAKAAC